MTEVRSAHRGAARRLAWRTARRVRTAVGRLTAGRRALPGLLVIGTQRGGTTSLHHYLAQHPRLDAPVSTKGVHWFDTAWDRPVDWYRAHFPFATADHVAFESSPYYLFHPEVPGRVSRTLPDVRVVAVLRDPVERAWSHYHHVVGKGQEELSFEDALAAEDDRLAGAGQVLAEGGVHLHHLRHSYVARGRYAPQVRRWWDAIGRDRVLLLDAADLRADPQGCCDRVCDLVGVPHDVLDLGVHHNARSYAPLDGDLRAHLRTRFADADDELRRLTGRTFSWMSP